jgi:hypothetical protein
MPNYHTTSEGNVPFTAEEEVQWAAEQASWIAGANDRKAEEVRTQRNAKLAETDWTQIADATADKQAWATYRQALRDVTTQTGFPWTITWPDAPQ